MDSSPKQLKPPRIHWVSATDSDELTLLSWALNCSSVVGLDAEWKPFQTQQFSFPTVSLLQIACQVSHRVNNRDSDSVEEEEKETDPLSNLWVFLVDLLEIPCSSIWEILRDMFVSPDILKLGFRFKQDLIYLSSTFCSKGCDPGFDRVEPFLDITSIYHHMQHKQSGRKLSKEMKSLATICQDVLGLYLSKELQCSDWSHRPLTEEQKLYAAADAQCLLEIFAVFQGKLLKEGNLLQGISELHPPDTVIGLQEILEKHDFCDNVLRVKLCKASDMIRSATASEIHPRIHAAVGPISRSSCRNTIPFDVSLAKIVRKYGEKILLKDSDRKPRTSKKKGKRPPLVSSSHKEKRVENCSEWQGPPPWDLSIGGDGFPKFLCDAMVEGLAKHLRCVGIDAATSSSKKPEPRQLIDQAHKEKRVLLTRDVKLLRHDYLIRNQVYRVKSLLKNDQLLEVIEIFQLKICEDQLMSRCTKCNGRFIQKALTTEEAVEAAKGFQVIPSCLFDRNLEFWQCMDCNQLYWEGTQYHNAVQKFIDVCKLSE